MEKRYENVDALIEEIGVREVNRLFEEYVLRLLHGNDKQAVSFADDLLQYNTETDISCESLIAETECCSEDMLLIGDCENVSGMLLISED